MKEIARRIALQGRLAGAMMAATIAAVLAAGLWAPAAMAVSLITVKTSFENSPISLNTSDAIGYAMTNSTGVPETLTFTDALPSGVTLDNPVVITNAGAPPNACTNVTVTNPATGQASSPGDGAVTVSATASAGTGTICTISLNIVPSSPSLSDAPSDDRFTSASTGSGIPVSTTSAGLVILTNPTLSFTAPVTNQTFTLGQVFDARFGCAQTDQLDSISAFFGTDDEGNQIQSGAPIDTLDPGARTLEVDCYSGAGGGEVSQPVSYQVRSYSLTRLKAARKTDYVSFNTLVPPGKLVAKLLYGTKKTVLGTTTTTVSVRGNVRIRIRPTTAGRKLLTSLKDRVAVATVQVSFMPKAIGTGDSQISAAGATVVTRRIRLPIAHPARPQATRRHG